MTEFIEGWFTDMHAANAEIAGFRAELAGWKLEHETYKISASENYSELLADVARVLEERDALRAAARQDAEALDRYRYAVAFAAADSWDGGPDMRARLEWARANDPGGNLTNDRVAEIGRTFPTHMRAVPRQDSEENARLKEALVNLLGLAPKHDETFCPCAWCHARAALACTPMRMPSGVQQSEENARLTEVLSRTADVLGEARSGCIAGSGPDEAWDKQRDSVLADIRAALACRPQGGEE